MYTCGTLSQEISCITCTWTQWLEKSEKWCACRAKYYHSLEAITTRSAHKRAKLVWIYRPDTSMYAIQWGNVHMYMHVYGYMFPHTATEPTQKSLLGGHSKVQWIALVWFPWNGRSCGQVCTKTHTSIHVVHVCIHVHVHTYMHVDVTVLCPC